MPASCTLLALGLLAVLVAPAARAQPAADSLEAPSEPERISVREPGRLSVRVTGGWASLTLGETAAFHEAIADSYRASGVPVPTQRSFAPGLTGGVDVLLAREQGQHLGLGARVMGSDAHSLYGDYAGTLDLVSTVTALFVESVSVVELRQDRGFQPFVGTRGGTVFASSSTSEVLDLGEFGSAQSSVRGRGVGYSLEGFGGLSAESGPLELFVQAGFRYARVPSLSGKVQVDGASVEEGRLPYALSLSGWTGTFGVTIRRP